MAALNQPYNGDLNGALQVKAEVPINSFRSFLTHKQEFEMPIMSAIDRAGSSAISRLSERSSRRAFRI